jgi:hypothetical protein
VRGLVGEKRYREIIRIERFATFTPQIAPLPEVNSSCYS